MKKNIHFSSKSNEWETPQELFDALNKEFSFTLDPCSTHENTKYKTHFTTKEDGLTKDWSAFTVFMNPPYGRVIGQWVQKAYMTAQTSSNPVVCLLPSRTDTRWWHDYCMQADEIRFIRGRLKFSRCENSAPFPSAIVVFRSPFNSKRGINAPVCSSL